MKRAKRVLVILGTCAVLSAAPLSAFAHGDEAGAAIVGGILGGLIGSAIVGVPAYPAYAPAPVVVERYAPPVVVERYEPAPVVVESYGLPRAVYYRDDGRRWHDHGWHRRHWHDDDD